MVKSARSHGELTRKLRIHDQFPFPLNFRESREDAADQKLSTRSNNFNILYVRARLFRETFVRVKVRWIRFGQKSLRENGKIQVDIETLIFTKRWLSNDIFRPSLTDQNERKSIEKVQKWCSIRHLLILKLWAKLCRSFSLFSSNANLNYLLLTSNSKCAQKFL